MTKAQRAEAERLRNAAEFARLLDELADYLRETEVGLRKWSRDPKSSKMHPVHAANRLKIAREQISREDR